MFSVHDSPQAGEVCTPEGRDCVEEKAGESFNCNIACEGIFADAQWIPEATDENIEGTDKNNLMRLIKEYKEFKKNVWHFQFDSNLTASNYGEKYVKLFSQICKLLFTGVEVPESTLEVVEIYFDTATFDEIERDKRIKIEAQLSLIGGTMGLLSGFSIISGIEIVYFFFKTIAAKARKI